MKTLHIISGKNVSYLLRFTCKFSENIVEYLYISFIYERVLKYENKRFPKNEDNS